MCIKYMYRVAKLRVELAYQHKLRYTRAFLPSPAIVSGMSQEMSKNDKMTWGISHNMSIIHLCIHACVSIKPDVTMKPSTLSQPKRTTRLREQNG